MTGDQENAEDYKARAYHKHDQMTGVLKAIENVNSAGENEKRPLHCV